MTITAHVHHIAATEGAVAVAVGTDLDTTDYIAFLIEDVRAIGEAIYERGEIILLDLEPWQIVRRQHRPTPTP
jgi:hypothetical protein